MVFIFRMVVLIIFIRGKNLLSVLLLLELLGFTVVYFLSSGFLVFAGDDLIVLMVFCVLVIEGVISLCGLIMLVSFSGRDYINSSLFIKI